MTLTPARLALLLAIPLLLFLASLYQRIPHIDDAWLGEQAYFLAEEGQVRSNLFSGLLSYEKNLLVYHKLFIWMGALVTKAFGFHLTILKSISLCALLFFLVLFWRTSRELWGFDSRQKIFFISILLTFHLVFELSFVFRPEVLMMGLGYLIYQQLDQYFKTNRARHFYAAAIAAGLSTVVHLNGLVFIGAGAFLLFFEKRDLKWLRFGLIAAPFALLYFANIWSWDEFLLFKMQFTQDPALYKSKYKFSPWSIPLRILLEHQRFFSHGYSIVLSVFCLASFWQIKKRLGLPSEARRTLTYFAFMVLCLALISHGKTNKYLLLSLPFLLYFPTQALNLKPYPKWMLGLLVAFLAFNLHKNAKFFSMPGSLVHHYDEVLKDIPKDKILLAPLPAIFDSLPRHTFISDKAQVLISETYSSKDEGPESLIAHLKNLKFDYLVVNGSSEGKFLKYLPQIREALHLKPVKELEPTTIYAVDPQPN